LIHFYKSSHIAMENNLDDFFAKKDKKKKGGPKKFSTANTEVLAKNLEETARKEQKAQDKEVNEIGTENSTNTPLDQQDEDEWDDYRENKKDFTGLKIENLTVKEPVKDEEEETEINEDGEVVKVKKDESGPWSKLGDGEGREDEVRQSESEAIVTQTVGQGMSNVSQGGKYVPPSMRGQGGAAGKESEGRRLAPRRLKAAPDLSSEVYFPSLSSAAEDTAPKGAWGRKLVKEEGAFEEVRQSSQGQNLHRTEAPKLTLGNKFDALRDE